MLDGLKEKNLETILSRGSTAPFDGVLVPYLQYYNYNDALERISEPIHDDCDEWGSITMALGFFVVGMAAGLVIDYR